MGGGDLHGVVDVAGPGIEGAPEDAGEGQHVVDLVGIVAAAGGHHRRTAGLGVVGEDLRRGVGAGEDDGSSVHGLHHLLGHDAGGGHADEHISPRQHVRQGAGPLLRIRHLGHLLLDPVHAVAAAGVDGALPVTEGHVPCPGGEQQLRDGDGGGAGTVDNDSDILQPLAHHFQGVGEPRQGDDGGAVLIVVEDGDVAPLLQLPLNLKAPGGGDILQIHAAEGPGQQGHGVHDLVHVVAADAQGNGVHAAEGLEQDAFALHDGHPRLRADVAQSQDGGAVGDHRHGVPPAGQLVALADVLLDLQAGLGHAGGVGQGQRLLAVHLGPGRHLQLAPPLGMQAQGFLCVIHDRYSSP